MVYFNYKFFSLIIVFAFITHKTNGQNENSTWIFGQNKWFFDSVQSNGFIDTTFGSNYIIYGTASISNKNDGTLLFYSNGITIFDKNGNIMQNGNQLFGTPSNGSILEEFYTTAGLCGGNKTQQPVIIVPNPNDGNLYYVISTVNTTYMNYCTQGFPDTFYNLGLRYAIVDISLNNGLGVVVSKNNILQLPNGSKGLTYTLNADGTSYWIITRDGSQFKAYKIDSNGVQTNPIISTFTNYGSNSFIKISPDGKYLFNNYTLFDFNNATGIISNPNNILNNNDPDNPYRDASRGPSSVEFSPNSNILYFTSVEALLCNDCLYGVGGISMYNILTEELIGYTSSTGKYDFPLEFNASNLQLSENGKIYLIFNNQNSNQNSPNLIDVDFGYYTSGNYQSYNWGVIDNPNIWDSNNHPITTTITPSLSRKNGYMFPQLIPQISPCIDNLVISNNVLSGQVDTQSARLTIEALNIINDGSSAAYDAGISVTLKPGFHSQTGSDFRSFIEGCTNNAEEKTIVSNLHKNKITEPEFLKIYPNPSKNILYVESKEFINQWELYDTFGNMNLKNNLNHFDLKKTILDISNLPKGVYYLRTILKNSDVIIKTVIKN